MRLVKYDQVLPREQDLIVKLNLSWTKYFPACSSQPWQVDGVLTTLLEDGYERRRIFPVENKTVVTNPVEGCRNNKWSPVLQRHGLPFIPLPDVEWTVHRFKSPLLKLNDIFPEGIEIPKMYVGKNICQLPTIKTHGHSQTTGAIKNSFGGLLKEVRHYAHEYMHEVLVDLMYMQRELHPGVLAVMDGTVMGDGAGPRTMIPREGNLILASSDQVAIDATAARIMGFDPLAIRYLAMCHERGLGVADPRDIEIVGDVAAAATTMGFKTSRSLVIWGDQLIRRGPLRPLKRLLLHSPLMVWAPFASNVYHDLLWYPTVGRARIRAFAGTGWGRLFEAY
ncbi:MAG: iron-sulfur cluster-binding protein [Candidatus Rokuibacteriota bacterium]|nr:MAG: iron-sulfur cluster-binding protein [Candidatus Rokubacteria bacterium]